MLTGTCPSLAFGHGARNPGGAFDTWPSVAFARRALARRSNPIVREISSELGFFGHGWPYAFAPQEWRANVMPSAYRFVAALLAMTFLPHNSNVTED